MIRHMVLMKARSEIGEDAMEAIGAGIAALRLPGMRAVTFGRSASPEAMERGYTHALIVDLDDWAALQLYADDPGHHAVSAKIIAAVQGGRDGLLVLDVPVEG